MNKPPAENGKVLKWSTIDVMRFFEISRQTVSNYVDQGMPMLGRGRFDAIVVRRWLDAKKEAEHKKVLEELDATKAEARYRNAKAETAELDLAVKRGTLVAVERVVSMWESHISAAKTKLMAIPARMAALVMAAPREKHAIQALLEKEQREALNELAGISRSHDRRAVARDAKPKAAAHVADAKKAKALRVGRRKKVHPSRGKSDRAREVANVPS